MKLHLLSSSYTQFLHRALAVSVSDVVNKADIMLETVLSFGAWFIKQSLCQHGHK